MIYLETLPAGNVTISPRDFGIYVLYCIIIIII